MGREPLVHHQAVPFPELEKTLGFVGACVLSQKGVECGELQGHVVGGLELCARLRTTVHTCKHVENAPVERTFARACCVGNKRPINGCVSVEPWQAVGQLLSKTLRHCLAGVIDGLRIRRMALGMQSGGEIVLANGLEDKRAERGIKAVVARNTHNGVKECCIGRGACCDAGDEAGAAQGLARFPFVEGISVMRQQEGALCIAALMLQNNGRRKVAQD